MAAGTSATAPWKHAPGDQNASDNAKQVRLGPGSRLIFAAGATYRGEIELNGSGSPRAPIVIEGAPGAPAVISGSDPVDVRKCLGLEACDRLEKIGDPVIVSLPQGRSPASVLFADRFTLRLAQHPNPSSDFYTDDVPSMLPVSGDLLSRGEASFAGLALHCPDGCLPAVALWVQPNVVVKRPVTSYSHKRVSFDSSGLKFYKDRLSRIAVLGFPSTLDAVGEYIFLSENKILALIPRGAQKIEISGGRGGVRLRGQSHVIIRNLTFTHMADEADSKAGAAISSDIATTQKVEITGNTFRNMHLAAGGGVVTLRAAKNVIVEGNRFERIALGSGVRLNHGSARIRISGNYFHQIGRTAIYLGNCENAEISHNIIIDAQGAHGNGLSAYLGNRNVSFIRNTVIDSTRPATFHGNGSEQGTTPNTLEYRENLLIATPSSLGSLISWGKNTRGVLMQGNMLFGGRFGMRLNRSDTELTARGNIGIEPAPTRMLEPYEEDSNRWFRSPPPWLRPLVARARAQASPADALVAPPLCKVVFGRLKHEAWIGTTVRCPPEPYPPL